MYIKNTFHNSYLITRQTDTVKVIHCLKQILFYYPASLLTTDRGIVSRVLFLIEFVLLPYFFICYLCDEEQSVHQRGLDVHQYQLDCSDIHLYFILRSNLFKISSFISFHVFQFDFPNYPNHLFNLVINNFSICAYISSGFLLCSLLSLTTILTSLEIRLGFPLDSGFARVQYPNP